MATNYENTLTTMRQATNIEYTRRVCHGLHCSYSVCSNSFAAICEDFTYILWVLDNCFDKSFVRSTDIRRLDHVSARIARSFPCGVRKIILSYLTPRVQFQEVNSFTIDFLMMENALWTRVIHTYLQESSLVFQNYTDYINELNGEGYGLNIPPRGVRFDIPSDDIPQQEESNILFRVLDILNSCERDPTLRVFFKKYDFVIKTCENTLMTLYQLSRARNLADAMVSIMQYLSQWCKSSITSNVIRVFTQILKDIYHCQKNMFKKQSSQPEEIISWFKLFIGGYNEIENSKLCKLLSKLLKYMLSFSVLEKFGLSFEKLGYTELNKMIIQRDFVFGVDFMKTTIEFIVFVAERALIVYRTGDYFQIFNSNVGLSAWLNESKKVVDDYEKLERGDGDSLDIYSVRKDLLAIAEKGTTLLRFSGELANYEKMCVTARLNSISAIQKRDLTVISAMKTRKSPFGILLEGGSSVGKSCLTDILFQHYGKVFGLRTGDEFKYTRNPTAKYWDNFKSHQWCVVLDEIGFLKPGASGTIDPTLEEVFRIMNNVAYVVDQASLEDKGRTPMQAKLCIGTTNVATMNADSYFSCPLAAMRRFPFMVRMTVKDKYADHNAFLDSSKIPLFTGESYPDYWDFYIYVVEADEKNHNLGHRSLRKVIHSIEDFLEWFSRAAKKHDSVQDRVLDTKTLSNDIDVCLECYRPSYACKCDKVSESSCDGDTISEESSHLRDVDDDDEELGKCKRCNGWPDECRCDGPRALCPHCDDPRDYCPCAASGLFKFETQAKLYAHDYQSRDGPSCFDMDHDWRRNIDAHETKIKTLLKEVQALSDPDYVGESFKAEPDEIPNHFRNAYEAFMNCLMLVMFVTFTCIHSFLAYCFPSTTRHTFTWRGREYRVPDWCVRLVMWRIGYKIRRRIVGKLTTLDEFVQRYAYTLLAVGTTLGAAVSLILTACLYSSKKENGQKVPKPQGVATSSERPAVAAEFEKANVWYNSRYEVCKEDLGAGSASLAKLDAKDFEDRISRNCVQLEIDIGSQVVYNRAFCLGGQLYVFNYHTYALLSKEFRVTVTDKFSHEGVSTRNTFVAYKEKAFVMPERDLVFMVFTDMPPRKSYTGLFPKRSFQSTCKMVTLGVNEKAELIRYEISCTKLQDVTVTLSKDCVFRRAWGGKSRVNTQYGDCGSISYTNLPCGTILLGIHSAGNERGLVCTAPIYNEDITEAIEKLNYTMFSYTPPNISAPSKQNRLIPLHHKSPVRYIEDGKADVYGSIEGFRPTMRSRVMPTLLAGEFARRGYTTNKVRPLMSTWRPKFANLKPIVQISNSMDKNTIDICGDSYIRTILKKLPKSEKMLVHVLDMDAAINGVAGIEYLDPVKMTTSTGLPWRTIKKNVAIIITHPDGTREIHFIPEVNDRITNIINGYLSGELSGAVFCACLKDQAVSEKKFADGKTRMFCGAPIDFTIVVRKYFLAMVRVIQRNRYIFECAPGLVVQSLQWEELTVYLTQHGADRIVAGDYANFDKNMHSYLIMKAFQILIAIMKDCGYTEDDIRVCNGIALDTAFNTVDFFGDLIRFYGHNPSGHPLTVIINGLVNSLYMRYAYYILNPDNEVESFQDNVSLMTYGDDNIMGVSKRAPWFNHTAIARVLCSVGVTYTMADKTAQSVPYIHIKDASFLKRSFRYDEEIGAVMAPIEHESITTLLCIGVRSKSMCAEAQTICNIRDALDAYFYYGRAIYTRFRREAKQIIKDNDLEEYLEGIDLPSFDDQIARFWAASEKIDRKWSLTTLHKQQLKPKLFNDSDPCFLRTLDISEKIT